MRLLLLAGLATALPVLAEPTLFYSKSFPGSTPAYVSIELQHDGQCVYKEAPDDEQPVKFKIAPEEAAEMYALAAKLEHFERKLESGLKVAFMGEKTFRWIDSGKESEQKFNYSQDEDANKLHDWFEKLTQTEQLFFGLERTVRFDKLGVHKAILQLEAAWDRKRLVAIDQFLPLLDRVTKNSSYLNMARERAAALAEVFRAPKASAPAEAAAGAAKP